MTNLWELTTTAQYVISDFMYFPWLYLPVFVGEDEKHANDALRMMKSRFKELGGQWRKTKIEEQEVVTE